MNPQHDIAFVYWQGCFPSCGLMKHSLGHHWSVVSRESTMHSFAVYISRLFGWQIKALYPHVHGYLSRLDSSKSIRSWLLDSYIKVYHIKYPSSLLLVDNQIFPHWLTSQLFNLYQEYQCQKSSANQDDFPHENPCLSILDWLVVRPPLKNMSPSVGIITFPTQWKCLKKLCSEPPTSWSG